MIRKAVFVLRLAGRDLSGNTGIHLVSMAIISAAFLTLGLFALVSVNLGALARHWEDKIEVCVYLSDGLSEPSRKSLEEELLEKRGVVSLDYVDKDQAMLDFHAMLGERAEILDGMEENPLPASFVLSLDPGARSMQEVEKLAGSIQEMQGVDEVDYGARLLESFFAAGRIARAAVLFIGGLVAMAAAFIVSNTIRLTMYARAEEIGIMKLVGAGKALVRLPFVIEGVLQVVAASCTGCALLWLLFRMGLQGVHFPGLLGGFEPVFLSAPAVWAILGAGALMGAAGSMSRVRVFLKMQ